MNNFTVDPSRFLFFTGKGGVGKTSIACATAIRLSDRGKRVLLVSTDPASNLDEVLGSELSGSPKQIAGTERLYALNIDPEQAAEAYRERSIVPLLGTASEAAIKEITEQLSGACTVEIAAFDEFTNLLVDDQKMAGFDHVIFDTAPTGHTLRLLSLPAAWSEYLANPAHAASCLGPSGALKSQKEHYDAAVKMLKDASKTTIVIVTRPDSGAIAEAERTSRELAELGLSNQQLVVNAVFKATDPNDGIATAFERKVDEALGKLSPRLGKLVALQVPLKPYNLVGLDALRRLLTVERPAEAPQPVALEVPENATSLSHLVDSVEAAGQGLIMVMGKGGVGKTTIASALAVELAARGHAVHLTTTDPASHVDLTLAGALPNLRVDHINPKAETQRYTEQVIKSSGKNMDAEAIELLREDLKSPCTEEVAVFRAFTRVVNEARSSFVVVDTAPTGHTLLLLDTAGSYHKEVMRSFGSNPEIATHVTTPLMRLKDPSYTKIMIVTLAENTPITEASALQEDLRRAGIEPFAWIVNQSFLLRHPSDPVLARRANSEINQLKRIQAGLARRLALVPWREENPVGADKLRALLNS